MIGLPLKEFYHCKLIPNNSDIKEYSKAVKKRGNYQPLGSYTDVAIYGKEIENRWRMIVDTKQNDYKIGDLLYLDGATPDYSKENGVGANAVITAVKVGYLATTIEIESVIPNL